MNVTFELARADIHGAGPDWTHELAASADMHAIAAAARLLANPGDYLIVRAVKGTAITSRVLFVSDLRNMTWQVLFNCEAVEVAVNFLRRFEGCTVKHWSENI